MKEGNIEKFMPDALGLISSKLTLEGPLIKTKVLLLYQEGELCRFTNETTSKNEKMRLIISTFIFYDLNFLINHKISKKDRVYISAYIGDDIF